MKSKYKLTNMIDDTVVNEDSIQSLCRYIDEAGLNEGDYHIVVVTTNVVPYRINHDLATYRQKKKNKGDVDVEPITVKGEVKDDRKKEVQGERQGLHLPVSPHVLPSGKPGSKKNK